MAEEGDAGEKTEDPSGRRLSQARSDGMVAKSVELSQVFGMTAAFYALQHFAPALWSKLLALCQTCFSTATLDDFNPTGLRASFLRVVLFLAPEILLIMVIAALFGAGSTAVQTKFLWSSKLFKPRWNLISPLAGIKRIFSRQNFFQLGKAIAKLCIIGPIAYFGFVALIPRFLSLIDVPISAYFSLTSEAMSGVFTDIMKLMLVLAVIDYAWQRYSTKKKLMMSKQEAKDEHRAAEGDEKTKYAIRQKGLARLRQQMMQAVKTADVVITNPTHYAVALRYSMVKGSAPEVVAKGRGVVALRIRELAAEHGVPIVERKPLARALFAMVEVGQQIPYELYSAVAEILAYVYRIKGKMPHKKAEPTSGTK